MPIKKDYKSCKKVNVIEILKNDHVIPANFTAQDLKNIRLKNIHKLDAEVTDVAEYKIPPIVHLIWLTNKDHPVEVENKYIDMVGRNLKLLSANKDLDWQFVFWTNDISLIPNTTNSLSDLGFKIKQIDNELGVTDYPLYDNLYRLIDEKYYALVSNMIRYVTLKHYGGIYLDTDYELFKVPYKLMRTFDFVAGSINTNEHSPENNIIMAKPDHPILQKIVSLARVSLLDPDNAPERIHHPCSFYDETVLLSGSPVLAPGFYSEAHKDGNVDIVFGKKTMTDDWRFNITSTPPNDPYSEDYNSSNVPLFGRDHYAGRWFEH